MPKLTRYPIMFLFLLFFICVFLLLAFDYTVKIVTLGKIKTNLSDKLMSLIIK